MARVPPARMRIGAPRATVTRQRHRSPRRAPPIHTTASGCAQWRSCWIRSTTSHGRRRRTPRVRGCTCTCAHAHVRRQAHARVHMHMPTWTCTCPRGRGRGWRRSEPPPRALARYVAILLVRPILLTSLSHGLRTQDHPTCRRGVRPVLHVRARQSGGTGPAGHTTQRRRTARRVSPRGGCPVHPSVHMTHST